MRLDSNGIARVWGRVTGLVYRPASVAMYGSHNLGLYLRSGNQAHLSVFLDQVNWLEQHAVIRADGAVVWPHDFDLQEGPILLRAPWVSANVQGHVISALVRGNAFAARFLTGHGPLAFRLSGASEDGTHCAESASRREWSVLQFLTPTALAPPIRGLNPDR